MVISTRDDRTQKGPPRQTLSLYPSDNGQLEPQSSVPAPARRPAKHRLGARHHNDKPPLDLSAPHWWRDPCIIPNQQIRDSIGSEIKKLSKRADKLEYGIGKKDQEIHSLKNSHASTVSHLKAESERVLELQPTKIGLLERNNASLDKKLLKKCKQVKKLKKLLFADSDSSD